MKKLRYILLLFACLLLWQCKPEPVPDPKPEVPDPAISIIGSSDISFSEDAGSSSVYFISTRDWIVTTGENWIAVSPAEGGGSDNIVTLAVSCSENPDETPRSGEVVIASGDISRIITVSQSARKPSGPKSQECELTTLRFFPSSNSSLQETISVVPRTIRNFRVLLITFPEGADMTAMAGSFEISKKAKVYAGNIELTSGKTPVDFTTCDYLTVVAEDGIHSTDYMVIARRGDPYIDGKVYNFMSTYKIPAVGLAVTKGEKTVYAAGYGLAEADAGNTVICTPEHLFRLASVSKTITATCILSLCQEGKLSLDDKVFAPGGPLASLFPGNHVMWADDIRVRDLLTHRSGWTNYCTGGTDPIFTGDARFYGKSVKQRVDYLLKNINLAYTPGTYYSYYNMGFSILGLIIEQVTGKSYEAYMREVAARAGADDIWVSRTPRSGKRANECVFYSQDGGYPYDNNMEISAACGGLTASAVDLARILTAIDYGSVVPDILGREWLDAMYTNYTNPGGKAGYGFGWWIEHYTMTNWAAYHTGSLSGTKTLWVRGNNGVNGVILCNSSSPKDSFETAMFTTLDDAMSRVKSNY